jgi:hypothetical protein
MSKPVQLSERDEAVAKIRYLGCEVSPFGALCAEFASRLYGGMHHFPRYEQGIERVDWANNHCLSWTHWGEMGSFDGSELTLAVLLAHDLGLRLTLRGVGPGYMRLGLGIRDTDRCFSGFGRHPTIEGRVADWREHHAPVRDPETGASPR